MSEGSTFEVLELTPIPPDTIAAVKEEVHSLIEALLRDAGQEQLLADRQIDIHIEQTFPTDQAIVLGLTLLSSISLEVFKMIILPGLKKRFEVKRRAKRGRKTARKKP
jgi:hypothetical protein